ncbi:60S acidic ribosomal protein P1 [Senna tora]|uniref:60S acidic ribosomal protein P1 n=1 Tax=Senna tora TaxID=362788 RepID=A0A835CKV8_9FABA|nr:60S acidic ribosomal protein P1 [Senna tora]
MRALDRDRNRAGDAAADGLQRQMRAEKLQKSVKMSFGELACSYAVMILHDDNIPVTAEKISTLVKAANVEIESYWASLFAKLAEKRSIDDLIMSGGGGGAPVAVAAPAAAAAGGGAAAAAAPAAEEKKKEEPQEESDDDMGFSLFD